MSGRDRTVASVRPVPSVDPVPRTRVEELYEAEQPGLVSLAWMLLGSREAAEDVVQDCFAALGRHDLERADDPVAHLRELVVEECRAVQRRRRRVEPRSMLPEQAHHDTQLAELADALEQLTPRRRMAVVLVYYCDLPVHEAARLMGCSPTTVSSLLHRSMKALKGVLGDG